MKKIIKEGNPKKLKKKVTLVCPGCECIFEAESDDFLSYYNIQEKIFLYDTICPFCNREVTCREEFQ